MHNIISVNHKEMLNKQRNNFYDDVNLNFTYIYIYIHVLTHTYAYTYENFQEKIQPYMPLFFILHG